MTAVILAALLGAIYLGFRYQMLYWSVRRHPLSPARRAAAARDIAGLEEGPLRRGMRARLRAEDNPRLTAWLAWGFTAFVASFFVVVVALGCL